MPAPELLAEIEDGLVDFILGLDQLTRHSFHAIATCHGHPVGFGVELGTEWEQQAFEDGPACQWGRVALTRTGPESDEFLLRLDEAYGTEIEPKAMAPRVDFSAVALTGDPRRPGDGPLKLKLFCNEDEADEARYGEIYLNFDVGLGVVELREKDPEYRPAIVESLASA